MGPGRIHHCMRLIGASERALELTCTRALSRVAFGKPLAAQGTVAAGIAESRMQVGARPAAVTWWAAVSLMAAAAARQIDQARMLTMNAAHCMDVAGNKAARAEIAMIKVRSDAPPHMHTRRRRRRRRMQQRSLQVVAPRVASDVIDRAMQVHGGAGLCQDLPLAHLYVRAFAAARWASRGLWGAGVGAGAAARGRAGRGARGVARKDGAKKMGAAGSGPAAVDTVCCGLHSPPSALAPIRFNQGCCTSAIGYGRWGQTIVTSHIPLLRTDSIVQGSRLSNEKFARTRTLTHSFSADGRRENRHLRHAGRRACNFQANKPR